MHLFNVIPIGLRQLNPITNYIEHEDEEEDEQTRRWADIKVSNITNNNGELHKPHWSFCYYHALHSPLLMVMVYQRDRVQSYRETALHFRQCSEIKVYTCTYNGRLFLSYFGQIHILCGCIWNKEAKAAFTWPNLLPFSLGHCVSNRQGNRHYWLLMHSLFFIFGLPEN